MSNKNHQKCISRIKKRQVNIDGAHEKNIFELLIKGHKAMSAYQLIESYSQHYGQVLKPMQVYRVLKKLITKHLVHRINYNNSYVACFNENDHEAFVGFICNKCSTIEEKTQDPVKELTKKFGLSKNHISQTNLEIVGTCQNCL